MHDASLFRWNQRHQSGVGSIVDKETAAAGFMVFHGRWGRRRQDASRRAIATGRRVGLRCGRPEKCGGKERDGDRGERSVHANLLMRQALGSQAR